MKNRARRITARYAAGVFRLSRVHWSNTRGFTKKYKPWERVSVGVAVRGMAKFRTLRRGWIAKDVIMKMTCERLKYDHS